MERIAGGEHADLPAALRQHLLDRARRTGSAMAAMRAADERRRQAEMALAAEHDLGARDEPARRRRSARRRRPRRCRRWTASGAVRQCAARADQQAPCDAFSFSAAPRKRGSWPDGWPARADLAVTLSLAGRTAAPAAQPVPVRIGGFGGAEGLADYLSERAHRCADRRHPSVRGAISANAAEAARSTGVPLAGAAAPALDRDRRRPLDRGRRYAGGGCRARRRAAPGVSRARPQGARAVRRRAAAPLSRPQRRSGRAAARGAARGLCHRRAGRSAKPTSARCSKSIASRSSSPRTAAATATYGKIAAARALGMPGGHAAPAGAAAGAGGRRRSTRRCAWLDHALAPRPPSAACRPAGAPPARAITRVSRRADDDERRHVGRSPDRRSSSVVTTTISRRVGPTARPKITGVDAGRRRRRRSKAAPSCQGRAVRDRIVERDDEAGARRRVEPALDQLPGLEIVRQRDARRNRGRAARRRARRPRASR